jgi:hypothetical protein
VSCLAHAALATHWPRVEGAIARGQWPNLAHELDPSDDLVRYVHVYAARGERTLWHCFRLGFAPYPAAPPSLLCVHPHTKELARKSYTPWWPRSTAPNINLQPDSEPPYFCFPYTYEWARTHTALPEDDRHRWRSSGPNAHTVSATLTELRRSFRPAYYQGYYLPDFEETLRELDRSDPSPFSPWAAAPARARA